MYLPCSSSLLVYVLPTLILPSISYPSVHAKFYKSITRAWSARTAKACTSSPAPSPAAPSPPTARWTTRTHPLAPPPRHRPAHGHKHPPSSSTPPTPTRSRPSPPQSSRTWLIRPFGGSQTLAWDVKASVRRSPSLFSRCTTHPYVSVFLSSA